MQLSDYTDFFVVNADFGASSGYEGRVFGGYCLESVQFSEVEAERLQSGFDLIIASFGVTQCAGEVFLFLNTGIFAGIYSDYWADFKDVLWIIAVKVVGKYDH